ncbi:protein peste [Plutella xylostella]|uniref:protein peste n=1 Tax=Plutella xylostella TaxID=51655 RepID=UPI002032F48E|nr:protein peste [Plutella xylostella]
MRGGVGRCRWLAGGVAALFALAAIAVSLAWQRIFDSVLASQLALVPGSRSYVSWEAPAVPLRFDIYLFNWTNAERFPEETPHVEQLGPYSFREERRHVNVTVHPETDSLSYRTFRSYSFDPEASNGTLEDNVTTLNPIASAAIYKARESGYIQQKTLGMGLAMFGQQMAVSKPARELMFEGYDDLMLEFAKTLPDSATGGAPKIDRFGWFYQRNNSIDSDGFMEVTLGSRGGSLPGQILNWNKEENLPYYSGQCAELAGSVGEFLPRDLTPSSRLTMFMADLCRTLHLRYSGSGELQGLQYHTYEVNRDVFDAGSKENECFCNGACAWGGVMNVSACRYGAPSFITLPHFLYADEELRELVTGLQPDEDKHSFYFSVEPKLGIPLDVAARFQLNIYMEPTPNIALYENVPRLLFPVLWVEQRVTIDDTVLAELRFVRAVLDWGAIFSAGVALVLAAIVALTTCTNICLKKPKYLPPADLLFERPKDEAEMKLNPM